MRTLSVSLMTLVLLLTVSCNKHNLEQQGSINFSFASLLVESDYKSTSASEASPKFVVLTVKTSDGAYSLNAEKIELFKLGDGYFTKQIEFNVGEYTIEDFFILDENDSVLYLTPKIGSEFEKLVSTPLPFPFHVSPENTTGVLLDVISSDRGTAEEFGYASFSFNIVKGIILQPGPVRGKDAVFSKIVPDDNYGHLEDLFLYAWTQGGILNVNRIAIEFSLSALPEEVTIDSALLSLYFNPTSPYKARMNMEGHFGEKSFLIERIIEDWDEDSITWNNQPATSPDNQVFIPDYSDSLKDYVDLDVSQLINDAQQNDGSSCGLMLKYLDEEPYKVNFFASSDHDSTALRPKLIVYYH